jgi:hypothetical protein
MLKYIAIAVAVIVVALVVFVVTRPDTFRIERSASIKAAPDKIHPLINNLQGWATWSPWEKIDPAMKRTFSGAASGVGAAYDWDGNKNIGSGRMEILETSLSRILIKLDFFKPFEAHNMAEFTLVQDGDTTRVTWAMYGPNNIISKLMSLFFSMDKMVGSAFEQGLADLKTLAEK